MNKQIPYMTRGGRNVVLTFPAKPVVCYRCRGTGRHVNPGIDGHGLGPEDFEDEDFREAYFSGAYDVVCHECKGERVVLEIDEERLSRKQDRFLGAVNQFAADMAQTYAEEAAERRRGA